MIAELLDKVQSAGSAARAGAPPPLTYGEQTLSEILIADPNAPSIKATPARPVATGVVAAPVTPGTPPAGSTARPPLPSWGVPAIIASVAVGGSLVVYLISLMTVAPTVKPNTTAFAVTAPPAQASATALAPVVQQVAAVVAAPVVLVPIWSAPIGQQGAVQMGETDPATLKPVGRFGEAWVRVTSQFIQGEVWVARSQVPGLDEAGFSALPNFDQPTPAPQPAWQPPAQPVEVQAPIIQPITNTGKGTAVPSGVVRIATSVPAPPVQEDNHLGPANDAGFPTRIDPNAPAPVGGLLGRKKHPHAPPP